MVRHVLVVGGGIAGLTVASRLANNADFRVTLLEASDRVGGRVHTIKRESAGTSEVIEKGAQWVHGENSIYRLIQEYGEDLLENDPFLDRVETNSDFGTPAGVSITNPGILSKYLELFKTMREGPGERDCVDLSVGDWFLRAVKAKDLTSSPEIMAFLDWLERLQVSIDGSDTWYESSVRGQLEYVSCAGCPTILLTRGYQSLINIILNNDPNVNELPSWVKLNSRVSQIDASSKPIVTKTEDGKFYESDAVVVAVPLGVLKAEHHHLFKPSLPTGKIRTIQNIGFGTVNKIHIHYDEAWWEEGWLGLNTLWVDANASEFPKWAKSLLGFYTSKTCPKTLTSWITGEDARVVEKVENNVVTEVIHRLLRKFMANSNIPMPAEVVVTKWHSNPLFRGSYSYRGLQSEEMDVWAKDLAQPVVTTNNGILCFAGEATHNSFYSTVHGAYETGIREANRLVEFFAKQQVN